MRRRLCSTLVGTETGALAALLRAQGHAPCGSRAGLHPLVVPLATDTRGDVLGLLKWPLASESQLSVVRTRRQGEGGGDGVAALNVVPCGTPAQYARRAAVEADHAADAASGAVVVAAADAAVEAGGVPYAAGELSASRLGVPHFLLTRVGPFADIWTTVARAQLAKGDATAALIAAERATALNPGWACCVWLQATLMGELGRHEEQRDLSLAALEAPFWMLGAPLREALAAAQLSHVRTITARTLCTDFPLHPAHDGPPTASRARGTSMRTASLLTEGVSLCGAPLQVDDLRELVRAMEDKVREQQRAPPRTTEELALLAACDALDEVVRTDGSWDAARPTVAAALRAAKLEQAAAIAEAQ
jgi:hypothetical protein